MTNARPQRALKNTTRPPRGADIAGTESAEVCELLLAELRARRARLQELLQLVKKNAERLPIRHAPLRPRAKCGSARLNRAT